MLHRLSNGPPSHTPSFGLAGSLGSGTHAVGSLQAFGAVAWPGRPHAPFGHSELVVHGAPALVPPMQRGAPQTAPFGQSAFELHGSPVAVAHVSQKQFMSVKPGAVHLTPPVASVVVPVVAGLKRISRLPTFAACDGGQSKLTLPKNRFVPDTSHR